MEWIKLTVSRLTKAKDILPYLAVLLALVYGLGWAIKFGAIASYGVGPITVPHESAITTSLAMVISLVPGAFFFAHLEWAVKNQGDQKIKFWIGQLLLGSFLFLLLGFFVVLMPMELGEVEVKLMNSGRSLLLFEWTFPVLLLLIRLPARNIPPMRPVCVLMIAIIFVRTFSQTLLLTLPESLGGLGRSRVIVHLKEPSQTLIGRWVASDSEAAILAKVSTEPNSTPKAENMVPAIRFPLSRVLDVVPSPDIPLH